MPIIDMPASKNLSVLEGWCFLRGFVITISLFSLFYLFPFFFLSRSLTAHAQLPTPILNALINADLSPNDISLVIIPLSTQSNSPSNQIVSQLPPAIPTNNLDMSNSMDDSQYSPILNNRVTSSDAQTDLSVYPDAKPLVTPIQHNASLPRTPASTMKLIPTFVALDTLGSDFTWQTKVYHTGYIVNQTLHGDLIIKGSGDPKLTHQHLAKLLAQVQQIGITHIDGNIILDSAIFQHVGKNPATFDNQPLRPYNASPDGLLINFNSIQMQSIPLGNQQALLKYSPKLADYDLPSQINQRAGKCQSIRYSLAPVWQSNKLVFHKALPNACGLHTFYIAYPNVKAFSRQVVKQTWLAQGNTLSGLVVSTEQPNVNRYSQYLSIQDKPIFDPTPVPLLSASLLPIATLTSLPLAQQIYDINHYSNNVMTEQLTLSISAYAEGTPQPTTYAEALHHIELWWQKNLNSPAPIMSNGSGLCRDCQISAESLADLLNMAYTHPDFNTYVNSLGRAGIDGTIAGHKWRLPNSAAIGRAWIKTGTLDNVTAMAGYVKGRSNNDYVVVGIINTPYTLNANNARRVLDTMLDWTAQH